MITIAAFLSYFGTPNGATTTTTTTTATDSTTETTTTTTTTEPENKTLKIFAHLGCSILAPFTSEFLVSDFAHENNIIQVKWMAQTKQDTEEDLIDQGKVDVCWGGGTIRFDRLMDENRLMALDSPLMQTVLEKVEDIREIPGTRLVGSDSNDKIHWISTAISTVGFTVNHRFFENHSLPVPHTWTDLTNASYGCLLPDTPTFAICSPETDLFQNYIFQLITMAKGWDEGWIHLARIVGNARIFENLDQAQSALEADEVGVLLTFDRQGFEIMDSDSDCEYIVPSDGTEILGEGIGIPIASSQKDLAEGFINFVMSAHGQSLWLNSSINKIPVVSSAFNEPVGEQAQDRYAVFNQTLSSSGVYFNDTLALDTMNSFKAYFKSVFIESHQELVDCWSLLAKAYHDGNITESEFETLATQMGTPVTIVDPITSEECKFTIDYARETNSNVENYRSLWTSAAKAQYQDVQNQIGQLLQNSLYRGIDFRYCEDISILSASRFRWRGSKPWQSIHF